MKHQKIKHVLIASVLMLILLKFKIFEKIESKGQKSFDRIMESCLLDGTQNSDKNIFFIETSGADSNFTNTPATLSIRQACSVESAARTNPNANIFMIFVSRSSLENSPTMRVLKSFKNVVFLRLDPYEFTKNTPMEEFIRSGEIFKTAFLKENISNILKISLLWRYGGTYLDLDVLSQVAVEKIEERNFIVIERKNLSVYNVLDSAIFNFNKGHRFTELFFNKFITGYNGYVWGHNSPTMISTIFHENCAIKEPYPTDAFKCPALDITLLPPKRGYPIHWVFLADFFNSEKSAEVLKTVSEAYFIHMYSSMSKKFNLTKSSNSAYIQLAQRSCPRVFQISGENFA